MGIIEDFREVVKGLRHKKFGEVTTKCCPNCGSQKIAFSSGFDTYPRLFGITPERYVCVECGYNGPLVMEKTEEK
jgi:predicted RNA-binding Zn-ribbon protein involved in translation (DUF1610 family)